MLLLDTNHLREFGKASAVGQRLFDRLESSGEEVATTIVCIEEQARGWLAEIKSAKDEASEIWAYSQYKEHVEVSARWLILDWDADAARLFRQLRGQGVRIGTMDLRIACIAMVHDALLLSRNKTDFEKVPGLRFENWLD